MIKSISVNVQSSIRIEGAKTLYFDPWQIGSEPHDADVVFITHEHYDHFSPEDINAVLKFDGRLVLPESMLNLTNGISTIPADHIVPVRPKETREVSRVLVETLPAYNIRKPFHIKRSEWLGYIVTLDATRFYISGDTDLIPEIRDIRCDVAFVGIGGTYSMDALEAAGFVKHIHPRTVVPTGYGSIVGSPADGEYFQSLMPWDIHCDLLLDA